MSESGCNQVRGGAVEREVAAQAESQRNAPPEQVLERNIALKHGNRLEERQDDRHRNSRERNVVDDGDRETADPHQQQDDCQRMPA